jgi:hypothetical protein
MAASENSRFRRVGIKHSAAHAYRSEDREIDPPVEGYGTARTRILEPMCTWVLG